MDDKEFAKQQAEQHKAALEHEKRLATYKPTPTIEEVALSGMGLKLECAPDGSPEQHIHPKPEPVEPVQPKTVYGKHGR